MGQNIQLFNGIFELLNVFIIFVFGICFFYFIILFDTYKTKIQKKLGEFNDWFLDFLLAGKNPETAPNLKSAAAGQRKQMNQKSD